MEGLERPRDLSNGSTKPAALRPKGSVPYNPWNPTLVAYGTSLGPVTHIIVGMEVKCDRAQIETISCVRWMEPDAYGSLTLGTPSGRPQRTLVVSGNHNSSQLAPSRGDLISRRGSVFGVIYRELLLLGDTIKGIVNGLDWLSRLHFVRRWVGTRNSPGNLIPV